MRIADSASSRHPGGIDPIIFVDEDNIRVIKEDKVIMQLTIMQNVLVPRDLNRNPGVPLLDYDTSDMIAIRVFHLGLIEQEYPMDTYSPLNRR